MFNFLTHSIVMNGDSVDTKDRELPNAEPIPKSSPDFPAPTESSESSEPTSESQKSTSSSQDDTDTDSTSSDDTVHYKPNFHSQQQNT